jgi:nicotinate-nucleotide adenylyltransferase
VLVPYGQPPHRSLEDDPGAEARVEMCQLAIADDGRFAVSRVEVDRPGPSYTADTLASLRESTPDDELVLILGGDQAAALPSWHEPERVLSLATVGVAARADWPRDRVVEALSGLEGADSVRFFSMPTVGVSSSLVRERAARGAPIRYLVPDRVVNFIGANNLYGASAPVGAD